MDNLPLGRYYIVEKETSHGYVLDNEPRYVDLTYRDQDTPLVTYSADWQNARQRVQVEVLKKEKDSDKLTLNGILNQRSQDVLAANNWNVCQYAVLMHMLAQVCDMQVGELVHVIADAHIYDRHIPIIKELIGREQHPAPKFTLNPEIKDFYQFTTKDITIEDYVTGPQIKNIPIAV